MHDAIYGKRCGPDWSFRWCFCSRRRRERLWRCDDVMTFESTQPTPFRLEKPSARKWTIICLSSVFGANLIGSWLNMPEYTHVVFIAITLAGSLERCLSTRPVGLVFKHLPRDLRQMLMNEKTWLCDLYIEEGYVRNVNANYAIMQPVVKEEMSFEAIKTEDSKCRPRKLCQWGSNSDVVFFKLMMGDRILKLLKANHHWPSHGPTLNAGLVALCMGKSSKLPNSWTFETPILKIAVCPLNIHKFQFYMVNCP